MGGAGNKGFIGKRCFPQWGFPGSSAGKKSTCNAGDPSSIPGPGRSPGEGLDYPLQYSWVSLVAQTVKNPPAMWETWVGKIPWRRACQPTPVFVPGESPWAEEPDGLQSTGHKESDTTEQLSTAQRSGKKWARANATRLQKHEVLQPCSPFLQLSDAQNLAIVLGLEPLKDMHNSRR